MKRDLRKIQPDYVEVPNKIIKNNKMVTQTVDIMFVNKITFIITYWREVGLTVEWIPNHTGKLFNKIKVLQLYVRSGFSFHTILMDMEFEKFLKHNYLWLMWTWVRKWIHLRGGTKCLDSNRALQGDTCHITILISSTTLIINLLQCGWMHIQTTQENLGCGALVSWYVIIGLI